ncbi:MAG TPA: hypothetical protein DDW85_05060, partial [Porphyromonadaceae bacterium]|nr:hypothetical protein [Porphyromonadaceae bacterium]
MNKEKGVACMYSDTLFPSTRLERSGGEFSIDAEGWLGLEIDLTGPEIDWMGLEIDWRRLEFD